VAQQVFPQDHLLARKHHLGVPTRKFYFNPPRGFTSGALLSLIRFMLALLVGIVVVCYGLYLDVETTISHRILWVWLWFLALLVLPAIFGLIVYFRSNKRLAILNVVSCILALLIVTLWKGIFFSLGLQPGPLSSILSGLFLQEC
jgi:Na+/proline symporter